MKVLLQSFLRFFLIVMFYPLIFLNIGCGPKKQDSEIKTPQNTVSEKAIESIVRQEQEKIGKETDWKQSYKNGWSFLKKAYLHGENEAEEIAENWFKKTIELCPKCPEPYFHLITIYSARGNNQLASSFKNMALQKLGANVFQKHSHLITQSIGVTATISGSFRGSMFERWKREDYIIFNEAGEEKFNLREKYLKSIRQYYLSKDFEKALDASLKAIEIYPNSTEGYYWIATVYKIINLPEKQLESMLSGNNINPNAIDIWLELGKIYLFVPNKDYEKALHAFKKALSLNPTDEERKEVESELKLLSTMELSDKIEKDLKPLLNK